MEKLSLNNLEKIDNTTLSGYIREKDLSKESRLYKLLQKTKITEAEEETNNQNGEEEKQKNTNEENLILNNKLFKHTGIKGKSTVLYGRIIQSNNKCVCCSTNNIVKNGTYRSKVLFNKINNEKIILKLEKQRYTCRDCELNFVPKVNFLEKRKRISNHILRQISIDTTLTLSNKQISRQNFVSVNTVERNLKKFKNYLIVNKTNLSKIICVDEFKGVKNYKNKMNFIVVDGEKHTVKDVLINIQKNTL